MTQYSTNYYGAGYSIQSSKGYCNNHDSVTFYKGKHHFYGKLDVAKVLLAGQGEYILEQLNFDNYFELIKNWVDGKNTWGYFELVKDTTYKI